MVSFEPTHVKQRELIHAIATPLTSVCLKLEGLVETKTILTQDLLPIINELKKVFPYLHEREQVMMTQGAFLPVKIIKEILKCYQKPYALKCNFRYPQKKIYFYGNHDYFKTIVINLLNNAVEAYSCNKAYREINIDMILGARGLCLIVSDHGLGIPWYKKSLIKLKGISFKKIKSGLGLYQVNQLIKKEFAGQLKFISWSCCGTIVLAYFPLY